MLQKSLYEAIKYIQPPSSTKKAPVLKSQRFSFSFTPLFYKTRGKTTEVLMQSGQRRYPNQILSMLFFTIYKLSLIFLVQFLGGSEFFFFGFST